MTTERDIQNQIQFAMDKGIEKGIAQGIEKGIEKGREEERVKIIDALKREGVPEEVIEKALSHLDR